MHLNKFVEFKKVSLSLGLFVLSMLAVCLSLYGGQQASAAPVTDFKAGRIIEDSVFTNSTSMTAASIQAFLNSKVTNCDTQGTQPSEFGGGTRAQWAANASLHPKTGAFYPPFTCIKSYTENGLSAAQIIYNISQQYQINPQVLIVLLQKEQSLITDTWPGPVQYKTATGYGCPDTADCDSKYFGLTNQLTWSAKMFRSILNNSPGWYTPYNLGNNFIRWSPVSSCGGSNVYIENRSTQALYNYTPYQPNASALAAGYGMGDGCGAYGNRNFYLYFKDWFGYNSGPAAFKAANSSTVYVPVEGYKMAVPSMAVLNDYGVSSDSIQIVSQSYIDARPTAPANTNYSSSIGYVVKSPDDADEDGGSVYLVSRGQRYQFQSMQQFYNFGFKESDISFQPLGYIFSRSSGGLLLDFVTSPSQEVFNVSSQGKRMYFKYATYFAQNPSDKVTPLSYYLVDFIKTGTPITDSPALVKLNNSDAVYVYQNNKYYMAPDYTTFSQCWGLDNTLAMPIYTPSQNNYIAQVTSDSSLSCVINDGTNNIVLNGSSRSVLPSSYGINGTTISADLKALSEKLPLKAAPLGNYIKTPSDASVWNVDNGKKRLIPSYSNFAKLGIRDADIDMVNQNLVNNLPTGNIKLANSQAVKTNDSGAVYVVSDNKRILYPSSELFSSHKGDWNNIETYSPAALDAAYPYQNDSVKDFYADTTKSKAYVMGLNKCYELNTSAYTSFGITYSAISSGQSYTSSTFPSAQTYGCSVATKFIKNPSSALVYWVDGGKKHPLNSYAAMVSKNNGQSPEIMDVPMSLINGLATGSIIN